MKDVLLALASCCEKNAPSRNTDCCIFAAVFPQRARGLLDALNREDNPSTPEYVGTVFDVPYYTSSFDAALLLRPDGWVIITISEIGADGLSYVELGNPGSNGKAIGAAGRDLILTFAAAALRARAA